MINDKKFNCFLPVTFEKSTDEKTGVTNYKFKSVASDDSKDSDGEEILPSGFDVKDFISSGYINYNHKLKDNPKALIGEPTSAMVKGNQLIVEGFLYGDSQLAQDVVETAEMLERSGSKRRIGVSIEGVPITRDLINPKKILKAKLTGAAFTFCPKNKNTWVELIKGEQEEDFINYEFEKAENANGSDSPEYILDFEDKQKGVRVIVDKDLTIKIEKCMTTASPSGKAVTKEHLEDDLKNLSFKSHEVAAMVISKGVELGMVDEKTKNKVTEVLQKAEFDTKERKKLAKKKEAESDGSYPIRNESDLSNAIKAYGRSKDKEKTKSWIKKRAKELGKENMLPETWD